MRFSSQGDNCNAPESVEFILGELPATDVIGLNISSYFFLSEDIIE